jgi:alkylation response protein AidB-like acyl-CoA dehydrogenase
VSHYKSNLRDIEFNLYEVLGAGEYFGTGAYEAVDEDQARMLLTELERFTSGSIWADSFVPADRTPLELSPEGDITIPEELDQALRAFYEAGWHLLPLPTHLGGYGAPPSIRWAGSELLAGGHATAMLWPIGALMATIVDRIGTEGQKQRFARPMIEE